MEMLLTIGVSNSCIELVLHAEGFYFSLIWACYPICVCYWKLIENGASYYCCFQLIGLAPSVVWTTSDSLSSGLYWWCFLKYNQTLPPTSRLLRMPNHARCIAAQCFECSLECWTKPCSLCCCVLVLFSAGVPMIAHWPLAAFSVL